MAAANRTKASDKQAIGKKLIALLKKHYKSPVPKQDRPVLETMLYGVCLEDVSAEEAEASFERMLTEFHDLNEVRVSSVSELEVIFPNDEDAEWKAFQLRGVLQFVFEKNFAYEFEALRKKTQDLAIKQLAKIRALSPFGRSYTLQAAVGGHVLPVDRSMARALIWLGLVEPGQSLEDASESLKPAVRKAEAVLFCHLLRQLATDPRLAPAFEGAESTAPEDACDLGTAPTRLAELIKSGAKRPKAKAKSASTKGAAPKKSVKKGTKKSSGTKSSASAKKGIRKSRAGSAG